MCLWLYTNVPHNTADNHHSSDVGYWMAGKFANNGEYNTRCRYFHKNTAETIARATMTAAVLTGCHNGACCTEVIIDRDTDGLCGRKWLKFVVTVTMSRTEYVTSLIKSITLWSFMLSSRSLTEQAVTYSWQMTWKSGHFMSTKDVFIISITTAIIYKHSTDLQPLPQIKHRVFQHTQHIL